VRLKDDKKPKQTARKMMEMMFAINVPIDGGKFVPPALPASEQKPSSP